MSHRGRVGVIAGAAAVVLLLLVPRAREAWSGPALARGRLAYDRGDFAGAEGVAGRLLARRPADPDALRLRARCLARLGRGREAIALDARLGAGRLEAEDLELAGRALAREGRADLAWAALTAATRLDPGHRGAADALAELLRPAAGAGGGDHPVGRADRLAAVPDARALAELVVGLAGLTDRGPSPLLGRALGRDRGTLRRLDSPAAARKLLARLLLEEGRASEAKARLVNPVDVGGAATATDPEAAWLLSRVALAEGDGAGARAALARAGDFGRDDPIAPEPSRHAGAASCAGCHGAIYRTQQSGRHARTIARGDALAGVPLPPGPVADPEEPGVTHRVAREGSRVVASADVHGREVAAVVDYALGSGRHGVTMLARDPAGGHRSMRISYYAGGDHWGLTSGFEPHPATPEGYIGEALNAESFRKCLDCHSTRFTTERDRDPGRAGPEAADHGIGCERCHGPSENHLRAVELGFPQPAVARPRLATAARRLALCAQCHGADGVIPPSDPRFVRFQGATLPYSRCVSESGGRLDCVACHDPHRDLETGPAYYEARCLACHGPKSGDGGPAAPAPPLRLEAVAAAPCPTGAAAGCVGCHMPKVTDAMPFTAFTDHHIRVHRPAPAGAAAAGGSP